MVRKKSREKSLQAAVLLMACGLLLSGCQGRTATIGGADPMTTASTGPSSLQKTAELGKRWEKNPKDVALGLSYADSLGNIGQKDQQLQVLTALATSNPDDVRVQAVYGKALLRNGDSNDAIPVLKKVIESGKADWRIYSAYGSALDQHGQYENARAAYTKALQLQPNNVAVINNMGMSYMLEGNLKQAETTLRSGMALPEAKNTPNLRQNLALVVGLQGRYDESRKIASEDLSPDEVDANLAYLQKMLAQPNSWQQLSTAKQ